MGRALGYRDAVVLLGGDPPLVAALDRALGSALKAATGGWSEPVLSLFDAKGRIVRLGRNLIKDLRERVRGTGRVDRTQRLEAAHVVIVVTAYFEALGSVQLPFSVHELRITRQEQLRLAGGSRTTQEFGQTLLTMTPPRPAAHLSYEHLIDELSQWYGWLSSQLIDFLRGLAVWDSLDAANRAETQRILGDEVCHDAVDRFQQLYGQLAGEIAEFGFWVGQLEHQATRVEVRRALAGVETLLASLSPGRQAQYGVQGLSAVYRAMLSRPILAEGDTPTGIQMPTLEEGYLDPDFRVRAVTAETEPAAEEWWSKAPVRSDLTEYLVTALVSSEATVAPLVVLGQPGAGKSVLTKILAARLPAPDFLPVRVALREVPADADVQDQIELAIRATTGERIPWPDLVRTSGGATPVVLLDGFDELLQATGVSQSDYLLKVSRFQQREADQGRPVVAVVTSRTAVADRARYPEGSVALRLEPFRRDQIDTWLTTWNRRNEAYLEARRLAPLPANVLAQHETLACQPLLLMMLALYDADANALQRGINTDSDQPLDEAGLYEELLTSFAAREVSKADATVSDHDMLTRVEQELQRLSLVAFGMLNRRRQWVTEAELDSDLAALFGRARTQSDTFRSALTQADVVLGRFFFVQRAQAIRDGTRLQTYEFLHATFGEYLCARLTVQLTASLSSRQSALTVGPTTIEDDLLYALLSFAPLSSRQLLRFVRARCSRHVPAADRPQLVELLIGVLADSTLRTSHRYASYRPTELAVSSRHGIYGANLVLLILALVDRVTASRLFRDSPDPPKTWHRRVLLWRSALTEPDWTDLALALRARHIRRRPTRDLEIYLSHDPLEPHEPVDLYWHYAYHPTDTEQGYILWHRSYWKELTHKMHIVGGTNDSTVRHAVEPLFHWLGPAITTFLGQGNRPASSMAHTLTNLWLSSTLGGPDDEIDTLYQQCTGFLTLWPNWDVILRRKIITLVLSSLRTDTARLPPTTTLEYLTAAMGAKEDDERILQLTLDTALATLLAHPHGNHRHPLLEIIAHTVTMMCRISPPRGLQAWITIHNAGIIHRDVFTNDPTAFLDQPHFSTIGQTHPNLLNKVREILLNQYP